MHKSFQWPLKTVLGPPLKCHPGSVRPKRIFCRNTEIYLGENWIFGQNYLVSAVIIRFSVFRQACFGAETAKMVKRAEIPKPKHCSVIHYSRYSDLEKNQDCPILYFYPMSNYCGLQQGYSAETESLIDSARLFLLQHNHAFRFRQKKTIPSNKSAHQYQLQSQLGGELILVNNTRGCHAASKH